MTFSSLVQLLQFRAKPANHPHEAHLRSATSLWLTPGLQLDLEIALGGFPAKVQLPNPISPAEDALKRRVT
ncbi:MAG TPA: hypothetical protein VNX27_02110 [Chthoniobacterales bacterium]|jgi:hypothetical protein|nr:hypothetical protein [Chthoniobacterales bacterium]